jgi:hypothetical protein
MSPPMASRRLPVGLAGLGAVILALAVFGAPLASLPF